MSYYRGDWYRGDYYRGDPGFWSALGGIGKAALGFIPGVGPALQAGVTALTTRKAPAAAGAMSTAIVRAGAPAAGSSLALKLKQGVLKHPVLTGAGAAGLAGAALGGEVAFARKRLGGGGAMILGGRRRRRMRATNTKALRRALRRAYAFERIAMKTIHLIHPKKKGRFGGFKRAKKRH
jgi:hypothetical protein